MNTFNTGLFGQNKPATGGFGQFGSGGFGQPSTGGFGQPAQNQTTNAFGQPQQQQQQQQQPAATGFGIQQPQQQQQQPAATGFGQTSGFGGFGTTNTSNPFGTRPAAGGFGTTTTTATPAFGQPAQPQQPQQANTLGGFGQQATAGTGFGLSSSTNAFGAAKPNPFGQATTTSFNQPSGAGVGFGQTGATSGFNQTPQQATTGFGQQATTGATGTGFGTGLFGQNKPATGGFGQFGSGGFGQPSTGAFGQPAQNQTTNAFGQPQQQQQQQPAATGFGIQQPQQQQQQPAATGFGQTSGFGGFGSTNTSNPFGTRPAAGGFGTSTTTTTHAFGQPAQPQQPQQANTLGGFGQQATAGTGFGLSSSTNAFGAAKPNPFGQATTTSFNQPSGAGVGFGQTGATSGFNQTPQQATTGFGQQATTGATGTGFGTGLFGQNKPATGGFGQFGSGGFGQPSTGAFGQPAQNQTTNAFGQPQQQQQQPAATGFSIQQPQQQQQQPAATGFGQTSGFGGFGTTSTSNPFGTRPAAGGFGTTTTTATPAFGQPAQPQQPQQTNTLGGFGQQATANIPSLPCVNLSFMSLPDFGETPYGNMLLFERPERTLEKTVPNQSSKEQVCATRVEIPRSLPLPQFSRTSTPSAMPSARETERDLSNVVPLPRPTCVIPASALNDILKPTLTLGEPTKAIDMSAHDVQSITLPQEQHDTNSNVCNDDTHENGYKTNYSENNQENNFTVSNVEGEGETASTPVEDIVRTSPAKQYEHRRSSPEVVNVLAPTCNSSEYDMYPSLQELALLSGAELERVEHFRIWRRDGKCEIAFYEPVNLKQLELTDVIELCRNGMVILYPHGDVPARGCGLNVCAAVKVNRVVNISESSLKATCRANHFKFISYKDNIWRYLINDSDSCSAENMCDSNDENDDGEEDNSEYENKTPKQFTPQHRNDLDYMSEPESAEKMSIQHDDNNMLYSVDNSPSSHRGKPTRSELSSAHGPLDVNVDNDEDNCCRRIYPNTYASAVASSHNTNYDPFTQDANVNDVTHAPTQAQSSTQHNLFHSIDPQTLKNNSWRVPLHAQEPHDVDQTSKTVITPQDDKITLPYSIPSKDEMELMKAKKEEKKKKNTDKMVKAQQRPNLNVTSELPSQLLESTVSHRMAQPTYYFTSSNSFIQRTYVDQTRPISALTLHGALARSFRAGWRGSSTIALPCYASLRDDLEQETFVPEVSGAHITLTSFSLEHSNQSFLTQCAIQLLQLMLSFSVRVDTYEVKDSIARSLEAQRWNMEQQQEQQEQQQQEQIQEQKKQNTTSKSYVAPFIRIVLRRKDNYIKADNAHACNDDDNSVNQSSVNDESRVSNDGTLSEEKWTQIQSCIVPSALPQALSRSEKDVLRQFNSVTSLIKALYSLPVSDTPSANILQETQFMCQLRRRELASWLRKELASLQNKNYTQAARESKKMFTGQELVELLLCNKLHDARQLAKESGNEEIARVISVCRGNGCPFGAFAEMASMNFTDGSDARERIVSLLSGKVNPFITEEEYEPSPEMCDVDGQWKANTHSVNAAEPHECNTHASENKPSVIPTPHAATWKQLLGIFVFYGNTPDTSAQDIVRSFVERFELPNARRGKAYPPYAERLTPSVLNIPRGTDRVQRGGVFRDACFSILEGFAFSCALAANCLHPHASSYYANDYLVPFVILCAIREIGVERNRPYQDAETSALIGFAAQLEYNERAWHWALLVLHMIENEAGRTNAVRSFCKRNACRINELLSNNAQSKQLLEFTQLVNLCKVDSSLYVIEQPVVEKKVRVKGNAPSMKTHAILQQALQQLSMLNC